MMCLRYMVWQTELFVILLGHFLPYPPKQAIKSKFWKNEKSAWRYYHFKLVYHRWRWWCGSWRYWQRENFFVISGYFLRFCFYPTNNLKNQSKFWKHEKNACEDIFILHFNLCTTNDNHMIYGSWDMEPDRCHFCGLFFALFSFIPNNPENQNFEKMKNLYDSSNADEVIRSVYFFYDKISQVKKNIKRIQEGTINILRHFGFFRIRFWHFGFFQKKILYQISP